MEASFCVFMVAVAVVMVVVVVIAAVAVAVAVAVVFLAVWFVVRFFVDVTAITGCVVAESGARLIDNS